MEIKTSPTVALAVILAILFVTVTVIDKDTAKSLAVSIVHVLEILN